MRPGCLAPLACLTLFWGLALSQEGAGDTTIEPGQSVRIELEEGEELRVLRLRVPAGARSVEVVLAADTDLDLAVDEDRLALDDAKSARHRGYTVRAIERVVIRPEHNDRFQEARVWLIHVFRTWNEDQPARAEVTAWIHGRDKTLLREGRNLVRLPAGKAALRRTVFLPRFVQVCSLRAEAKEGAVAMVVKGDNREIPGSARGAGNELRIGRNPVSPGEEWILELRALSGKTTLAVVEMDWAIRPDRLADAMGGGNLYLGNGREGVVEYDFEDSERADFFFDVGPRTHAFEITVESSDGEAELYVARFRPPILPAKHISFAALGDEKTKRLVMGGRAPLPAGRYWVRVDRDEDESREFTLRWKRHTSALSEKQLREEGVTSPVALRRGSPAAVVIPAGKDRVTFRLPGGLPVGAHLQLIGSRIDADFFLRRADTGEVLEGSASDRLDEYMRIQEKHMVPSSVQLLLDVFRWDTGYEESAGHLHVGATERPAPAPGFLPPYEAWKDNPRDRAMAATVEIDTDDGGGTGTVVSPSGLILTALHLFEDADESEILVAFPFDRQGTTRQCLMATIEARSDEETDLALLALRRDLYGRVISPDRRFAFAPVGRARKLELGDPITLLGYPSATSGHDGGHLTLLPGIVSSLQLERNQIVYLAANLPTSGGNSGGGVFNAGWEIVGVHLSTDTLAFSRPCESLPKEWIARIRAAGGVVRAG